VKRYADRKAPGVFGRLEEQELLTELGLFAHFPLGNRTTLHTPAVLCFGRNPEHFFPQAKSSFVVGLTADNRF
jgi:hypothetical protein